MVHAMGLRETPLRSRKNTVRRSGDQCKKKGNASGGFTKSQKEITSVILGNCLQGRQVLVNNAISCS